MENNHFNVAWAKSTALYTKAASVLGVGYPEMMVLYALESMGELTQKQIAENFGMQKQTVHTVVSALQKKGYLLLEASEGDKREKRIVLTESGQVYAHRMIAPLRKTEEKVYRTIGNERLQAMCEILDLFNLLFERELTVYEFGHLFYVFNCCGDCQLLHFPEPPLYFRYSIVISSDCGASPAKASISALTARQSASPESPCMVLSRFASLSSP